MKLLVNELKTSLFQVVSPSKNTQVEAIRLNLYKHNFPAGSITLEVQDENGELIAASSDSLSAVDLNASAFSHGFISFSVNVQLRKDVNYRIVLKASGYSFSEAAYFGWCNNFDLEVYPADYTSSTGFKAPLSLQIWERI